MEISRRALDVSVSFVQCFAVSNLFPIISGIVGRAMLKTSLLHQSSHITRLKCAWQHSKVDSQRHELTLAVRSRWAEKRGLLQQGAELQKKLKSKLRDVTELR